MNTGIMAATHQVVVEEKAVAEEYWLNEQKELCMSYGFLCELVGNLKTVESGLYRNRRDEITTWRHTKMDSGKVWIVYKALPLGTRQRVDEWYAQRYRTDIYTAWRNNCMVLAAGSKEQMKDSHFFEKQDMKYSAAQVGDLIKAGGWLRWLSDGGAFWEEYGLVGKTRGMQYVAELIGMQNLYGFKVSNGRVLERRINDWKQMGLTSLLSDKFGTKNAVKKLSDEMKATGVDKVVIQAAAMDRLLYLMAECKYSIEQATNIYNSEAKSGGLPTYTLQRFWQILKDNKMEYLVKRDGLNVTRNDREAIVKRRRPDHVNQLWSLDGTTIQLYGLIGDKVVKVGYWVMVTDACTDCVIGYAFGKTETTDLVLRALRMAVERAKQLPQFVQYDGGKANLSSEVKDLFKNMNTKGLKAQPYNGKSKYVERIIGKIEQGFMRLLPNFVGGNITTRSLNSKANVDVLKMLEKQDLFQHEPSVLNEMRLIIETYNHTKVARLGMSPAKAYQSPKSPKGTLPTGTFESEVSDLMIVALFWVKKAQDYMYRQAGLHMELNGTKYEYIVPSDRVEKESMEFRDKYLGKRFFVRYNPDDLSKIHLYDADDKHVAMAVEKYAFAAVPTEGEMGILKEIWQERKDNMSDSLKRSEERKQRQLALGNAEANYELAHKEAMNEAAAYLETQGWQSGQVLRSAKTNGNDDAAEYDLQSMYDLSGVESGKVIEDF